MTPIDPAVTAPANLMSVDEFWDFVNRPENESKFLELRKGKVIELSRPTRRHGAVTSNMALELGLYARRIGQGYVASNDSGVILVDEPATVVGPDVAYFTDANTFDEIHPKWGEEVPVLAVEVLSPTDKPSAVNEKIEDYLKNGVNIVRLFDYEQRKVTVYRPDRTLSVLKDAEDLTGGDELPGFTCKVADLFRLPAQPFQPPPA
ncbi:MAG: Uma2 family endonuclease [Gemmataceae bacterium]|nr:Uma2 family endonuclease [Gemmataceae bacterium]